MKFCPTHWQELRDGIAAEGLEHLVSASGEDLVHRLTTGGFDPLHQAHLHVIVDATDHPKMDGHDGLFDTDACVVCYMARITDDAAEWIGLAVKKAKRDAQALGLATVN